jgi:multiple sugar transport system substrate-binding protein
MPSLTSAQTQYKADYPQYSAFVDELSYAHPDIAIAGDTQALSAFDSSLAQLGSSDPSAILKTAQTNLQAVLDQAK